MDVANIFYSVQRTGPNFLVTVFFRKFIFLPGGQFSHNASIMRNERLYASKSQHENIILSRIAVSLEEDSLTTTPKKKEDKKQSSSLIDS